MTKPKIIRLHELNREDLELVARWNGAMFLIEDTNDQIINRIYKTTARHGAQVNVNCVVDEESKAKALDALAKTARRRAVAAETFNNGGDAA